jgi:hypothetical protein
MWWWPSIDDMQRTRRAFENATTKGSIYFLLGMVMLSGILALRGAIQLSANPALLNQISEPIVSTVIGFVGFAFFFPWFFVTYFARCFLLIVNELERKIEELRSDIGEDGGDEG